MSWAKFAIEKLKKGETVKIRPRGHSMKGKINDGNLVTVAPCKPEELSVGDIVLVRVALPEKSFEGSSSRLRRPM